MRKINFLILSTPIVVAPVSLAVSCGAPNKVYSNMIDEKHHNWKELKTKNQKNQKIPQFVWEADKDGTITDAIDQMDLQLPLKFSTKISKISPYGLAKFVVNLYNKTNGGIMEYKIRYQNQEEIVSFDFNALLDDLINTFDQDGYKITKWTTTKQVDTFMDGIITFFDKSSMSLIKGLQIFGKYADDIFGAKIADLMSDNSNVPAWKKKRAIKTVELFDAFPPKSITKLPNLFKVITTISDKFKSSSLATQWAFDNNLQTDFNNLGSKIIKNIMESGN